MNFKPLHYLRNPARSPRYAVVICTALACGFTASVTTLHLLHKHTAELKAQAALHSKHSYDIIAAAFHDNKRSPDLALACGAHYWTSHQAQYRTLIDQGIANYCRNSPVPSAACKR